jgi:hypothetical protein
MISSLEYLFEMRYNGSKGCIEVLETLTEKESHIQKFTRKTKITDLLMKIHEQFQYFTTNRSSFELVLIDFEVFQCSTIRVKYTGFAKFLEIFLRRLNDSQYQLRSSEGQLGYWGFRLSNSIITNLVILEEKTILQSKFEFIWNCRFGRRVIKIGLNCLWSVEKKKLVGGEWLVVVKFHESKLSMMVKEGSKVETVIQRIVRWLAIGQEFIELTGRLFPGDVKRKLTPEMNVIDERNKINYVNVGICEDPVNNIKWKEYAEDDLYMMAIQVGGTIYRVNKYLIVKSFKRLLVNKFNDHSPELYGSDDGICYDDWMIMKDIDCSLMVIW